MPLTSTSSFAALVIADRHWLLPAMVMAVGGSLLVLWHNRRRLATDRRGPALRIVAWLLLCACLVNPMWSRTVPRSGANLVAVLVDTSRSNQVRAGSGEPTRAEQWQKSLADGEKSEPPGWLQKLEQDFELRRFTVSERLQQVDRLEAVTFDGTASALHTALRQLQQRFDGQPLAAVLLLSDGIATDTAASLDELSGMPPVYPVLPAGDGGLPDVTVGKHAVTQTAFDDAPVTIQLTPRFDGVTSGRVAATLRDAGGAVVETQTQEISNPSPLRFRHRPDAGGTVFYELEVALQDASGNPVTDEATLVNNRELIAVDRGTSARRVLYVGGRPNWEFKFLRRAVETDPQLQIAALIRIARKEAKFDFRGRDGETANSLFRGFDGVDKELTESYDEPVLVRLNTRDEAELRDGFPEAPEALFQYDAIVLDDIEAAFFRADQLKLLHDFVTRRGGGLLMLGGQESLQQGGYDRTPVGELLPLDLSRALPSPDAPLRLTLTADGWLQPWIRLHSDEVAEEERLASMPEFLTLNAASYVRPGAVVMAEVRDPEDNRWPALVVQRFGRGRTAALCIGDFWRWRLNDGLRELLGQTGPSMRLPADDGPSREGLSGGGMAGSAGGGDAATPVATEDLSDHARACRQLVRWLVADVPRRLDVSVTEDHDSGPGAMRLQATVRSAGFELSENADVTFQVTAPDGTKYELTGEPADDSLGVFHAAIAASQPGAWRATVSATVREESNAASSGAAQPLLAETGWAYQPDQKELRTVQTDTTWLEEVARVTGGRTVSLAELPGFVGHLPSSRTPLTEIRTTPLWHSWWLFLAAVACLVTDWTLRRRRGLP
jgi:uncharacterized membrane protein